MEGHDKMPEERIGTVGLIRKRAVDVERLAEACDAEAAQQQDGVDRLRARAQHLRTLAEEYVEAAHMAEAAQQRRFDPEDPLRPAGVYLVTPYELIPETIRPTDTLMVQDPVDPTTYRKHTWSEVDQQWGRSR